MLNVKINFSIEVGSECFAEHSVEYVSIYEMRHPIIPDEQKLATEIINKMNALATDKTLKLKNWESLFGKGVLKHGSYVSTCSQRDIIGDEQDFSENVLQSLK